MRLVWMCERVCVNWKYHVYLTMEMDGIDGVQ